MVAEFWRVWAKELMGELCRASVKGLKRLWVELWGKPLGALWVDSLEERLIQVVKVLVTELVNN